MSWNVFYITTACFLIGASGVFFIAWREDAARACWKKFFIYALAVYGVENAIISQRPFPYLCAAILLAGFNEIILVWHRSEERKWHVLLTAIIFFGLTAYAFFNFSQLDEPMLQLYIGLVVFIFEGFNLLTAQLLKMNKPAGKSSVQTAAGTVTGTVMALSATFLLKKYFSITMAHALLLTLMICVISFAGMQMALRYRHIHHVDHFGRLIPGHGGILDLFSGFIMTGAVWWVLSSLRLI